MVSSTIPPIKFSTNYKIDCVRDGKVVWTIDDDNLVVFEGLEYVMGCVFSDLQQTEWYLGLCTDVSISSTDTMQHNSLIEFLGTPNQYRPMCEFADTGLQDDRYTYTAPDVQVMVTQDATLAGGFLTTDNFKGGSSGYLYGAAEFSNPSTVKVGDALLTTVTVSAKG